MTMYQWGQASLILVALVLLCWAPLEYAFTGLWWRVYCWAKGYKLPRFPRLPKATRKPRARMFQITYPVTHDPDHRD